MRYAGWRARGEASGQRVAPGRCRWCGRSTPRAERPPKESLGRGARVALGLELVAGEGAHDVEHAVPRPGAEGGLDHRCIDQVSEGAAASAARLRSAATVSA